MSCTPFARFPIFASHFVVYSGIRCCSLGLPHAQGA